jgi:putative transposase
MIDRSHALPITRQAKAPGVIRSTVYALPRSIPERDLELMKRIDRLHLEMPFAGSRMLRDLTPDHVYFPQQPLILAA